MYLQLTLALLLLSSSLRLVESQDDIDNQENDVNQDDPTIRAGFFLPSLSGGKNKGNNNKNSKPKKPRRPSFNLKITTTTTTTETPFIESDDEDLSIIPSPCPEIHPKNCNPNAKFRTFDGTCNNPSKGLWGSAGIASRRFINPRYADRFGNEPRGGLKNLPLTSSVQTDNSNNCEPDGRRPLPSPRLISTTLNVDRSNPSKLFTSMLMQMGQFLDHDITLTPPENIRTSCCGKKSSGCLPITTPKGDRTFPSGCQHFVRSMAHCTKANAVREQKNKITAFIDASHVYGSDPKESAKLRTGKNGHLKASKFDLVPPNIGAGDERFNVLPTLTSMHSILLREHNRLADEILKSSSRTLRDEDIFQQARRILIAEWQNIVYSEYIPLLVGSKLTTQSKMNVNQNSAHDPNVDPSIRSGFATASYRFGHSQIQSFYSMFNCKSDQFQENMRLKNMFFNTSVLDSDNGRGMDKIILGLTKVPVESIDPFYPADITNSLFGVKDDLVSRNIQRGRDHGTPSYNEFREFCGLRKSCSWNEKPDEIDASIWNTLKKLYPHPKDIDFYVGGVAEKSTTDGLTGPTFTCLNAVQFKFLKDGDRYFFTHSNSPNPFNARQLANIRSRTLADLICDNSDIKSIRAKVFHLNSPEQCCTTSNKLDIKLFI